jgi:hypothetical protein
MTDFFQLFRCSNTSQASCEHIPWWDPYYEEYKDYAFNEFDATDGTYANPGKNYFYRVRACAQGFKNDENAIINTFISNRTIRYTG